MISYQNDHLNGLLSCKDSKVLNKGGFLQPPKLKREAINISLNLGAVRGKEYKLLTTSFPSLLS